jgi:hypothetical protein
LVDGKGRRRRVYVADIEADGVKGRAREKCTS